MKIVFLTSVLLSVLVFSGCSIQNSNPARINSNGMGGDITDLRQETNNISESEPQNKEISINYGFLVDNVDSLTDCNFWKDKKFGKVDSYEIKTSPKDAAGSLVLKGRVVQRVKDAAFSESELSDINTSVIQTIIYVTIWSLYLWNSKRAKNTFIN